jgi:hypothetical protein
VRARTLRAPVFLSSLASQTGRCAPLPHRSFTLHHSYVSSISVNFCDFLTPTDAVTENPQNYFAAEKYY